MTGQHRTPLSAWRLFALDEYGTRLVAPFVARYWPEHEDTSDWCDDGLTVARCLTRDHRAPAEECTCGLRGTVDLDELLRLVQSRRFAGSERTILQDAPVLARVALQGFTLDGADIPHDDPPTTVRSAAGRLLELHVSRETLDSRACDGLWMRYGRVPLFVHEGRDWARAADPRGRFLAVLREAGGLGLLDLDTAEGRRLALEVAGHTEKAMRADTTREDMASVLFHSKARPTLAQAFAFVDLVRRHLCPEVDEVLSGLRFGEQVSLPQVVSHAVTPFAIKAVRE